MSEVVIFAVGILVFLITVYGTVVTGGLLLTGRQLDDDPNFRRDEDERSVAGVPVPDDY